MHREPRPHRLRLTLGNSFAVEHRSAGDMADNTRQVIPALVAYDVIDPKRFYSRMAIIRSGGITIAAIAGTQTRFQVAEQQTAEFIWSCYGQLTFNTDNHRLFTKPASKAVYIPEHCPVKIETSDRSTVAVKVDPKRLDLVTKTMLGIHSDDYCPSQVKDPCEVRLQFGAVSFNTSFQSLFAQIDEYATTPDLLAATNLDDFFYRTLAIAMSPEAFCRQSDLPRSQIPSHQLDRLCQYIMTELPNRISLTDLERLGHMSRRGLNYAFMKTFQMSPMAWVREQRLLRAQQMLSRIGVSETVSQILYACGFTNASLFSRQYLQRFGETPSETRAQGKPTR